MKNNQDIALTNSSMNPLGEFQGLKSVAGLADTDFVILFQEILIDLPCGEYFRKFIDDMINTIQGGEDERITIEKVHKLMNDKSSSEIKVAMKKIWLMKFHRWITANCNGSTVEHMDELLKAEGDWETLQIIYNSFNRDMIDQHK